MKNYNQFINESLRDKMVSKNPQEIRKAKEDKQGKDNVDIIRFTKYLLNKKIINNTEELYSLEEIKDYMDNQMSIIGYNGAIRFLDLDIPLLYPNKKQMIKLIEELKKEGLGRKNHIIQLRDYIKKEFEMDILNYIDIDKMVNDIQKKKEQN